MLTSKVIMKVDEELVMALKPCWNGKSKIKWCGERERERERDREREGELMWFSLMTYVHNENILRDYFL